MEWQHTVVQITLKNFFTLSIAHKSRNTLNLIQSIQNIYIDYNM